MGQNYSHNPSPSPDQAQGSRWPVSALKPAAWGTDGTLCRICATLPIQETLMYGYSYQAQFLSQMGRTISLSANCTLCGMMVEALRGQPHFRYKTNPTTVLYQISGLPRICIDVYDKSGGPELRGHIRLLKEYRRLLPSGLPSNNTTEEDENFGRPIKNQQVDFRLIRSWLDKCVNDPDHDCGTRLSDPTDIILIDVQERRLVRKRTHAKYLALSYVWGQVGGLQTENQNYQALQEEGSLSPDNPDIPRVIVDSMILTQQLHERYLWVDRLCIIQDDVSKHASIQNMGKIYSHALLTIFALSGEDATHGLPGVKRGSRPPQTIRRVNGMSLAPALPSLQYALEASLHTTRGWTFQEVLLSPRRLFFSDRQAYFTCMKGNEVHCEDCPKFMYDWSFERVYGLKGRSGLYGSLVESYTRRTLRFDSDVLDAFSGISSLLNRDNYMDCWEEMYSGLPRRDFLYALLWCPVQTPIRRPPRTRDQIEESFPSWSWIGWKGAITYNPVWTWSDEVWREEVFAPGPIDLLPLNGPPMNIYRPRGSPHEGYCSCAFGERINQHGGAGFSDQQEQSPSDIASPNRQSILQFQTLSVPAICFSHRQDQLTEDDDRANSLRLFDGDGKECGIILAAVPPEIDSIVSECKYLFLCYGREPVDFSTLKKLGIYDALCNDPDWCRCVPFFLLVRPAQGVWERVALAIIQPRTFEREGPKWEDIRLG
ncbi:HET-domain-containing protein [Aspergillus sclerotiicarbonarius CBS 121057]|uniref:HET-domain-containing protein n=1 Tax=Aspergillus sclerotiicarbonarius (strain CBS 121057 / IBT 28362) TaxID=1448318 RepID=A0A319EE41_ASPSB|nr:HET-domain-containing protein [Aspergillus sclerotiicarbonarius CBS 121057]